MKSSILRCAFHEFSIYMYLNQHTEQQLNKNFREAEDRQKRHRLINTAHTFSVQDKRSKVKSVHETQLTGSHGCWTLSSFVAWRELKYCKFSFWEANSSKDTSPPPPPSHSAFHQVSLTISRYLFILLDGDRHCFRRFLLNSNSGTVLKTWRYI